MINAPYQCNAEWCLVWRPKDIVFGPGLLQCPVGLVDCACSSNLVLLLLAYQNTYGFNILHGAKVSLVNISYVKKDDGRVRCGQSF